jgi:hypothetical protein
MSTVGGGGEDGFPHVVAMIDQRGGRVFHPLAVTLGAEVVEQNNIGIENPPGDHAVFVAAGGVVSAAHLLQ